MSGRFRDRFSNFMSGRYGVDEFSRFLMLIALILCIVSIFVRFVWIAALLVLIYTYFRMFSRNYSARNAENQWYCSIRYRNRGGAYGRGNYGYSNASSDARRKQAYDRKLYRIYKCPNCGQKIRVPRHKGRICIKCPKCRIEFIKKT